MADIDASKSHNETEEEMLARHRKEVRDLTATTTGMKKQATKGEKKKKKEISKKIEEMEAELKHRHQSELKSLNGGGKVQSEASLGNTQADTAAAEENDDEYGDELNPEDLLADLELEEKKKEEPTKQVQTQTGPKRNRRKEKLAKREEEKKKMMEEAASEAANQTDYRKIELENLEQLCKRHNLTQYDITPDGHCLFASISDQLLQRHGITRTVQELRKEATKYMRDHADTFSPFLFDEETLTMKELEPYCIQMETTASWGGDMEILALAKVYDCCISILFSGRSLLKINEEGEKPELRLVYYKHSYGLGEHYNSLRDV